jgi:predicted ribosome quality control (RQC) complex YloA/Tae2 family protein
MSLDGFSLYAAAAELDKKLTGGRIDRVFQPNKHTILLQIRQPRQNYTLHISILPQNPVIGLIDRQFDNPPAPPTFCMVLRKQIEDGRIAKVRQLFTDRVIEIDVDVRGINGAILTKTLIAELTGKYSNLILTEEGRILDCLKKIGSNTSRIRQILPNHPYIIPPQADRLNLRTANSAEFIARLREKAAMKLSKAIIAVGDGTGPVTAKELCYRAGFSPDITVGELSASDFNSLSSEQKSLGNQMDAQEFEPVVIVDENKKLIAVAAFKLYHLEHKDALTAHAFSSMSEALDYATAITDSYRIPEKDMLAKLVRNELNKTQHKYSLLEGELAAALDAEQLKINGDILMTYQYAVQPDKNARSILMPDLYSENPEQNKVEIAIDPLLSLSQNAQSYYNKYNKAKRAQEQLAAQLEQCEADINYLKTLDISLESSDTLTEITEIKTELANAGFITLPKKKKQQEKPSKPLSITAPDGTLILIGKNNFQNDRLTQKTAQAKDIWLHTKDIPGSHVIIRTDSGEPTEETLHLAAQFAAHFSKAENSSNIPVDYTQKRFVKKPNGAKPGFVIYTNQKTLFVSPDNAMLEKYLR